MSFVYNYEYKITSASFSQRITTLSGSGGTTTGSFTGSFTGSLQGTASYANNALSSSFALSSSYALSASFAPSTPSFPFTGSALITGSLGVTGSISILGNSNTVGNNFIAQNLTGSEIFRLQNDRDVVIGGGSASTNTQVTINPFRAPATTNYVLQVNAGTDNFMRFINSPGSTVGGLYVSRDATSIGRRAFSVGGAGGTSLLITSNGSIGFNAAAADAINTAEILSNGVVNSNEAGKSGLFFVSSGTNRGFIFEHLGAGSFNNGQAVFQITKNFTNAESFTGSDRLFEINGTYNFTNGVKGLIGINYNPTITALSGTHYGLLIRPSNTLNGIGHTTNLPTATWHVKGNSDSVGNVFVAENLSNTANVTIGNNGITTFSFGSGGKVFINAPVGAGDTLLEIRRSTSSSGGFIFRSDNGLNQALTTTNGAFNINTPDNSNITLNPGTGAVILNTAVNNYNSLSSTSIQFRVGTLASSVNDRWLNFGHNTNYGMILQAAQNGATPAIDRLALNPYGGITTLCGELPNSFVDVLVSSGTGLRIYRGGITNGVSFKVGNAVGFGMLITHEDTTNTSGYANIQIIQGNNAVFSAGRANSATLNNFYGNGYGTIDSYAMMVGVKYDYAANTTRGITFSATNTSTNANIIQSVHDGVGKPLSLNTYGGNVSIGNLASPTSKLDILDTNGYNQLRLRTQYTPTSTADTNGNQGDICFDDNYIYYKTNAGWKRSLLETF